MRVRVIKKQSSGHWAEENAIYEVSDAGSFWLLSSDKFATCGAKRVINKSCCEVVSQVEVLGELDEPA